MFLKICILSVIVVAYTQATPFLGEPVCPDTGREYFPDEDCRFYYICDNGYAAKLQCPNLLFFDPVKKVCVWANQVVDCVGGTRPPGTWSTRPDVTTPVTNPTSADPSTGNPTTQGPTTESLTTQPSSTTQAPSTPGPTTPVPTTEGPSTST